jgi:hypothetical protein
VWARGSGSRRTGATWGCSCAVCVQSNNYVYAGLCLYGASPVRATGRTLLGVRVRSRLRARRRVGVDLRGWAGEEQGHRDLQVLQG